MGRLVLSIQRTPGAATSEVFLARTPTALVGTYGVELQNIPSCACLAALRARQLTPSLIRTVGETIRLDLDHHPEIKACLTDTFREEANTPIYFMLGAPDADEIPWETLYDANHTFVDTARWPIGRIKNSGNRAVREDFEPPFSFLAVLAAGGVRGERISAEQEWDAIYGALQETGVTFEMRVLVCEDKLLAKIKGINDFRVAAAYAESSEQILEFIGQKHPRFIHFFCHGLGGGEPELRIATRQDWVRSTLGNIRITAKQLADRDADKSGCGHAWLLTLNCCDSAAASPDAASLAASAVIGGIPATVGMRQLVTNIDAHRFTRAFYRKIGVLLTETMNAEGEREIEFTSATAAARREVLESLAKENGQSFGKQAEGCLEWTLPIIYNRAEPLHVNNITSPKTLKQTRDLTSLGQIMTLYPELERLKKEGRADDDPVVQVVKRRIAELAAEVKQENI